MKYNEELIASASTDGKLVQGEVIGKENGYGFLAVSKSESYFIPPYQMNRVIHGDFITARINSTEGGKKIAVPESLVKTNYDEFIARIKILDTGMYADGKEPVTRRLFKISNNKIPGFNNGDWIKCRISQHPIKSGIPRVSIISKIADYNDVMAPWKVVIAKNCICDLDLSYSNQNEELTNEIEGYYEDATNVPFITIDSGSTRDMDDAVHCIKTSNGYQVNVAITDVSYFIKNGSAIDDIAFNRAVTTYMPSKSIPIVPRDLSEFACSLAQGELRRALCCTIYLDKTGKIEDYEFKLAKIKSTLKANYEEVTGALNGLDWPHGEAALKQINLLFEIGKKLHLARSETRSLIKYGPDNRFSFDARMKPIEITSVEKGDAHQIIEELMIATNICAASLIEKSGLPGLFVCNNGVDKSMISGMLVKKNGYKGTFDKNDLLDIDNYHTGLKQLSESELIRLGNTATSSSIELQARPHYGMGLKAYATITSPIRKYTDMHNQRLIKSIILGESDFRNLTANDVINLNESIKKSAAASEDVNQWLFLEYYSKMIGQTVLCKIVDIDKVNAYLSPVNTGAKIILNKNSITCFKGIDIANQVVVLEEEQRLNIGDEIEVEIIATNINTLGIFAAY